MELLANAVFWTAVLANLTAQTLKLLLYYFLEGRFQWHRFLDTGGMPSTHSATVSALAVSVGLREGFDTSLFAVAAVFALIVMYDAAGIRRAAGLHAQLLNQLMEELGQVIRLGPQRGPLKELLGHTYLEVAVGALIGGLVALGAYRLFPAAEKARVWPTRKATRPSMGERKKAKKLTKRAATRGRRGLRKRWNTQRFRSPKKAMRRKAAVSMAGHCTLLPSLGYGVNFYRV
mgnify:CR=1 FL=1